MLTYEKVKAIILDELRAKGYSPNPADVHLASANIMEEVKTHVEEAVKQAAEELKKAKDAIVIPLTPGH